MTIQKFFHSCLLLQKKGKRLLIDPGNYSFPEGGLTPKEVGSVDAILISHQHADHFDPKILREFMELGSVQIWTIQEIGRLLVKEGIQFQVVTPGTLHQIAGFEVEAFQAQHGPLPIPLPENVAYHIDSTVLHPGDSFHPEGLKTAKVLALPIAGPWLRLIDALEMVDHLQPEVVIPIHDAVVIEPLQERMYVMLKTALDQRGIIFRPLERGEILDNP